MWTACRHQNHRFGSPATKMSNVMFAYATALFLSNFPNPEAIAPPVLYNLVRFTKNALTPSLSERVGEHTPTPSP